jgi:hypothetical protein
MAVGRAPAQRSVVCLDPGGRPRVSHLLAVCPSPEPVPVRGSVKRNELDIRTALKHATDHGKVAGQRCKDQSDSRDYVQKTGADGKVTWVEDKEHIANCQLRINALFRIVDLLAPKKHGRR